MWIRVRHPRPPVQLHDSAHAASAAAPRRWRWRLAIVAALVASTGGLRPSTDAEQAPSRLLIQEQVTFLYFNDLSRAAGFYGRILALPQTLDLDWVKIFRISPTSSIGLVDAEHGAHRPSEVKPVMVSLVVDDVDAWYQFLTERGVEPDAPPATSERVNVRSFGFRDPEGHTLEVFTWLDGGPLRRSPGR